MITVYRVVEEKTKETISEHRSIEAAVLARKLCILTDEKVFREILIKSHPESTERSNFIIEQYTEDDCYFEQNEGGLPDDLS